MGAGLHGLNGLHIRASLKLWNCYVLPKLLYGLAVLPLTATNKDSIDAYQKQTMRRLLHLPPGIATAGLYLILGVLPADDILARNTLTLFRNVMRYLGTVEHQVVVRQRHHASCVTNDLSL